MGHVVRMIALIAIAGLLGSMGTAAAATGPDGATPMPMPRSLPETSGADRGPPPELLRMDHATGEITTIRPPAFDAGAPLSGAPGMAADPRPAERGASSYVAVARDPRVVLILFNNATNGARSLCSGAVVNRYVVLTATHCIANGRTAHTNVQIIPAYDRTASSPEPYGRYSVRSSTWYPQDFSGGSLPASAFDYDIGFYTTNEPIGTRTGWFGWQSQVADPFYGSTVFRTQGYPAEVVGDGSRQLARNLIYDRVLSRRQQYCYDGVGYGGSSGSGVQAADIVHSVRSNANSAESCDVVIFSDMASTLVQAINQTNPSTIVPESGFWWNASQGGRGYAVEYNATTGNLFMASFVYSADSARSPLWYVSTCSFSITTGSCNATLEQYAGGQSMNGSYRPPTPLGSQGTMRIAFSSATAGTLTLPNGTSVAIVRYPFAGTATPVPGDAGVPQTGWWWNASQGGRGWFMEVQKTPEGRNTLFLVGYMYDAGGQASWHVATGVLSATNLFEGTLTRHEGGSPISATTVTGPTSTSSLGSATILATSSTTARLYLPGPGGPIELTRYKP